VAESVNAEITSASSRVVVPGSDAQYWLAQVIPATSTTQGLFLILKVEKLFIIIIRELEKERLVSGSDVITDRSVYQMEIEKATHHDNRI
jgi:hypothetical protein